MVGDISETLSRLCRAIQGQSLSLGLATRKMILPAKPPHVAIVVELTYFLGFGMDM